MLIIRVHNREECIMSPLSIYLYTLVITLVQHIVQVLQITNRCQHYKEVPTVYISKQVHCASFGKVTGSFLIQYMGVRLFSSMDKITKFLSTNFNENL